jgi:glycosyltransferase involved in cell wall biosynthesis
VFLELHDTPGTDGAWEVVRQADGLVAITSALRDHLLTRISAPERVIVAHDGVDLDMFDSLSPSGRRDIRDRLGYDDATTVVGYTGRVNDAKGVPTILEAAELLAGSPVRFLFVGKVYDDMAERAALVPSVTMIGFVPPADVSAWTAAMDIVVMSTSAEISYAEFTSPLKLFEYMASGRPVLCSDLPVMREVLTHESNALFFHADCAESLAAGIARIRGDTMLAESIARRARSDVARYTWDERARRVLAFVTDTLVTSAPI